jgi:outer membrane protein assembly factor BamB
MHRLMSLVALATVSATISAAENTAPWPQFRGPAGSAVAESANPPTELGPDKNVKWKVTAPSGISSPIIVGDLVVLTAYDDGKLLTIAYRRADGREAWRADAGAKQIEKFHKLEGSPAASTPVTDGQRIYSYFGSCGLLAYDLAGKELWRSDMPPAATAGDFGSGVSPIVTAGLVIIVRDQVQDAKIIALEAATGKLRWEQKRQSPTSYSTPVVWDTPAGKQVAVAGHARLIGYDLATGEEKWSVAGIPSGCCPSPVISGETLLFAGAGSPGTDDGPSSQMPSYDKMLADLDKDKNGTISKAEGEQAFAGFFDNQDANKDGNVSREEFEAILKYITEGKSAGIAVKVGGSGDITTSHVLWNKTKGLPYIASALAYQGQYIMVKDGGIVTALDAKTGDEIYQKRAVATGTYYASPVAAGGNIYFTSLADGTVTVLKAGTRQPEVVATNEPLGERTASTPAIAGNTIYIRTAGHLYAFSNES